MPFNLSKDERRALDAIADTLLCGLSAEQIASVIKTTGHSGDAVKHFLGMSATELGVVDEVTATSL